MIAINVQQRPASELDEKDFGEMVKGLWHQSKARRYRNAIKTPMDPTYQAVGNNLMRFSNFEKPIHQLNKSTGRYTMLAQPTHRNVKFLVESMVSRGATTGQVKGSKEFRRRCWLYAQMYGLELTGYKASPSDKRLLEALQRDTITVQDHTAKPKKAKAAPDKPKAQAEAPVKEEPSKAEVSKMSGEEREAFIKDALESLKDSPYVGRAVPDEITAKEQTTLIARIMHRFNLTPEEEKVVQSLSDLLQKDRVGTIETVERLKPSFEQAFQDAEAPSKGEPSKAKVHQLRGDKRETFIKKALESLKDRPYVRRAVPNEITANEQTTLMARIKHRFKLTSEEEKVVQSLSDLLEQDRVGTIDTVERLKPVLEQAFSEQNAPEPQEVPDIASMLSKDTVENMNEQTRDVFVKDTLRALHPLSGLFDRVTEWALEDADEPLLDRISRVFGLNECSEVWVSNLSDLLEHDTMSTQTQITQYLNEQKSKGPSR